MVHPSRTEFQELARRGNLVPVYRELPADLETPVSVMLKLRGRGQAYLLESVEGGESLARYSFIGVRPARLFSVTGERVTLSEKGRASTLSYAGGDPLDALRAHLAGYCAVPIPGLPRFTGGAVGYISFDMVRRFERIRSSRSGSGPSTYMDDPRLPDAAFFVGGPLVAFDHVKHRLLVIGNAIIEHDVDAAYDNAVQEIESVAAALQKPIPERAAGEGKDGHLLEPEMSPARFAEAVRKAQEHIAAGDIFQVVLSQRFKRETEAHPFDIYRALRRLNPSPYMFFIDFGDLTLIGSSPEMLVRLENGAAQLNPIAGTRPRAGTQEEDERLEQELRADPKERAEHVMLVDLGRNDLGRVCAYGSVQVTDYMTVERYSHVMHLVSRVAGQLRPGLDAFDLLRATFPAGTVSGAPKVRAIEIIDELEASPRGPYAGGVGYFGFPSSGNPGNMDLCITIRTIVMRGGQALLQAGAGIVADSIPESEHDECRNKARALAEAIRMAERGD